jgi:hypothetical protein
LQARAEEIEANGGVIGEVKPVTADIPQLVIPVAQVNTPAIVNFSSTYPLDIPSVSHLAPSIGAHQGQKQVTASLHVSETKSSVAVSGSANQPNINSGSTPAVSTLSCYYPTSTNGEWW